MLQKEMSSGLQSGEVEFMVEMHESMWRRDVNKKKENSTKSETQWQRLSGPQAKS
jgi:hypothetical protein